MTARDPGPGPGRTSGSSSTGAPTPGRRRGAATSGHTSGHTRDASTTPARGDALERWVHLLDSQFRIPVLGVRFGIDPLIGLVPGLGDLAGALLGLAVLTQARRERASAGTLARMVGNLLIDLALGAIPLVGDVFDAWYKANRRNFRLLQQDRARRAGRAGSHGGG